MIILLVIVGVGAIRNYQMDQLNKKRLQQMVDKANERSKDQSNEERTGNGVKVTKKSDLTDNNLNLAKRFNRDEVAQQAQLILGIISDETRREAIDKLPMTDSAYEKYYGDSNNIYYGKYTKDVDVNIVFAGLDYSDSDKNYSANVLAEVTYYGDNNQSDQETISLVIHYNGREITSWSY